MGAPAGAPASSGPSPLHAFRSGLPLRLARAAGLVVALVTASSASADIRHEEGPLGALFEAYLGHVLETDPLALDKAATLAPDSSFIAFEQAYDALRRGDANRMVELAEKAVRLDPGNGDAHALLANASLRRLDEGRVDPSELDDAIAHAERAMKLGAADQGLYDRIARAHAVLAARARSSHDEATAVSHLRAQRLVLEEWAERFHQDYAWRRLADFARDTEDASLEERSLSALLGRGERPVGDLQRLADVERGLDRCEEAVPLLEEAAAAADLDPYSAISVQVKLGECAVDVDPQRAATAFARALVLDPTNRMAALGRAEALWRVGRREEATAALAALGAAPDDRSHDHRRAIEDAMARARWLVERELPQAVDAAREAVELSSALGSRDQAVARAVLGDALLSAGDAAGAEAAARDGLSRDATSDAPLITLVNVLWATGRKRDAAAEIAAAEKKVDPSASWHQRVARWESTRGFDEAARRHAKAALAAVEAASGSPSPEARGAVADLLVQAGDPEAAQRMLESALALRPGDEDLAFALADALEAQGKPAPTADLLPPISADDEYALLRVAGWESTHRRHEAALAHARAARSRVPIESHPAKLARFDTLVAAVQLAAGDADGAAVAFAAALSRASLHPPERWLGAAAALEKTGRPAEALARLDEGLRTWPDEESLVLARARLLVLLGRQEEGIAAVDALLALPSTLPGEHAQAALVLADAGAAAAGRRIIDAVLARFPDHAALWLTSGRMRDQAGEIEAAESDLRRGLALDPSSASALNAVGYFLASRGRSVDEAVKMLERAVQSRPHEAAYLDSLGWALLVAGRLDDGAHELEKAVARERDPVIVMHLATARERQGRPGEALALYREALAGGLTEDQARAKERVAALSTSGSVK